MDFFPIFSLAKHPNMKKSLLASALFISAISFAQVTVSPAGSPSQIATFLSGNGVVMSNVVVTGSANSYGYFTAINTQLGMNGGFVLTTGDASFVVGPNNSPACGISNGTGFNDTDLTSISPYATYDVCMIEMDCVPTDDTLYFNYVFGSEEYPEFINSFNDAFGIFVSGANPAGGNYFGANMTVLPNGSTPVCIDSINNGYNNTGPCTNCAYYVDNTNDTNLQYDGTTTNMMAIIPVIPGQTYHLKIIVGDAMDEAFDSGVFLQAGSFRCIGQPLDAPVVPKKDSQVGAYPVPATTAVNFTFASLENSEVSVVLHSLDGKAVLTQNSQAVNNVVSVDLSSIAEGTYIAEIKHDGITETKLIAVAGR